MSVLCLTGWQQSKDALEVIAPAATHFDYSAYDNVDTMFAALPPAPKLAIGWSLGGQLLVRAIAGGYTKPKQLLLLGAPFQCVADEYFPDGMQVAALKESIDNYHRRPKETLTWFNSLIGLGDVHESQIIRALNSASEVWKNGLFWLEELGRASCRALDFSSFPSTVIVHGDADKVINPANAKIFYNALPASELFVWPGCAHAPHLHGADTLRKIVARYV